MFWRLHFKWTLGVHFPGGDIYYEKQDTPPQDLMDELVDNCADLNDPKWQSGVGAEVLAEFIQQQMSLKWTGSDDGSDGVDSGDGDD